MLAYTYAIIEHSNSYYDFYEELLTFVKSNYRDVESGVQGDAWIWVKRDNVKVEIDTFYSMNFEIHAENKHQLLEAVINTIQEKYPIRIYDPPIER